MASQFFQRDTDRLDFRLAKHLKHLGIDVIILVPSSRTETKIVDGLKVYCVKPTPIIRSLSGRVLKGSYIVDMFLRSLVIVKKEKIDLLYAFFAIPPGVAMMLCRKATGRPLVLGVTGADVGLVKEINYGFRLNPVANRLVSYVLRNTDRILVPSLLFKDLAVRAGADRRRIRIIPWGVKLERYHSTRNNEHDLAVRMRLGLNPRDRIILALCRHSRVKGLNYLLHAMPRLLHTCPDAKLVLAGLGKETERLKNIAGKLKVQGSVVFPGYVHGTEKLELFRIADVFVQPSLSDAFPLSAVEAMASGVPVVITSRVGLADFLENGECGFIVESGNPEMLADAILKLLSDDNLRLKLGRRAREKAGEFSWDKFTREVASVYRKTFSSNMSCDQSVCRV